MSASTSRSPACSPRAWWCTRPTQKPNGEWVTPAEVKIEGADDGARARRWPRPASRSRSARSRRCRSRSATPSTPTTSSATYGADVARWFMLSDSPPERDVELDRARRAGRLAVRPAAVAAGRRGGRDRQNAPADAAGRRSASRRSRVRKAAHGALAKVIGRDREAALQRRASPTSTSSPMRSARPSAQRPRRHARFRLGDARGRRHPGAAVPPDDAASGRGVLGGARPQHPGRRRALAGGRAGAAGRGHHHAAGPGQRQEAGRRDGRRATPQTPRSRLPCWRSMRYNGRSTASARKRSSSSRRGS